MLVANQHILSRISAALDADPFADPVTIAGVSLPRKDARRFERELIAKTFPRVPSDVASAGDCLNGSAGAPHPFRVPTDAAPARHVPSSNCRAGELKLTHFHAVGVVQP